MIETNNSTFQPSESKTPKVSALTAISNRLRLGTAIFIESFRFIKQESRIIINDESGEITFLRGTELEVAKAREALQEIALKYMENRTVLDGLAEEQVVEFKEMEQQLIDGGVVKPEESIFFQDVQK